MKPLVSDRRRLAVIALAALSSLVMALPSAVIAADHASYVLFAPGSESTSMSGSVDDIQRARGLRVGSEALLYVRQGGASYVIRDPATLREANAIFKPQAEMGARQAELGSRQAALGSKQAALGAQQARLGALQADAMPSEQAELARQQGELGRRQGELGEQQAALGEQQSALGREQDRLGRIARDKFEALLADALKRGVAQRID